MKLNEKQIKRFTEIFEIKVKSIILIEKEDVVTIVINSVIIFDVTKELVKEFLFCRSVQHTHHFALFCFKSEAGIVLKGAIIGVVTVGEFSVVWS